MRFNSVKRKNLIWMILIEKRISGTLEAIHVFFYKIRLLILLPFRERVLNSSIIGPAPIVGPGFGVNFKLIYNYHWLLH